MRCATVLLLCLVCWTALSSAAHHKVVKRDGKFLVRPIHRPRGTIDEILSQAVAANEAVVGVGSFENTLLATGWNKLNFVSSADSSNEDQAYAAGYYEGSLTYQQAVDHYNNYFESPQAPRITPEVDNYFTEHVAWLEGQIAAKNATSDYWYHIALQWKQWHGLRDGLNDARGNGTAWSVNKLLALTSLGDLFDIFAYFNVTDGLQATDKSKGRTHWTDMSKPAFERWFATNTHCSSLFKLTDDLSDIFFGHASWFYCRTTMRIFKHITLNYQGHGIVAKTISMSSYPGMLSSFDDYYVTDSGIAAIETSLGVYNYSMYVGNIKPQSLLYWQRTMTANRLATSAPHWAELVAVDNSGTYNNQWMILDMNMFTPGKPLPPNTMWVAEQLPGVVASQDVTDYLRYGYYPSYNVPMNLTLFVESGYAHAAKKSHQMADYQTNVRGEIFRRDQATVKDLDSFIHIMQYNDYEQDPLSNGNPLYAIASRVDLDPHDPECFGAIDAKVSSYSLWKKGQITYARSGLTPQQPHFGFNITSAVKQCNPHVGLPEYFNFDFQEMKP